MMLQNLMMFILFKKYYIVWKGLPYVTSTSTYTGFKKYYIVWKDYRVMVFICLFNVFKKYYIVWKDDYDDNSSWIINARLRSTI